MVSRISAGYLRCCIGTCGVLSSVSLLSVVEDMRDSRVSLSARDDETSGGRKIPRLRRCGSRAFGISRVWLSTPPLVVPHSSSLASFQVPGPRLPVPEVSLLAIPQGAPQSERAALGEAGGEPGAGPGGGVPVIKSGCLPRRLGQRDSRAVCLRSELGDSACRDRSARFPQGGRSLGVWGRRPGGCWAQ